MEKIWFYIAVSSLTIELVISALYFFKKSRAFLKKLITNKNFLNFTIPLIRILLGFMLIVSVSHKFSEPNEFVDVVASYKILPSLFIRPFALILPFFELSIGLGLIFSKWNKEFSLMALILMLMFIIAISQALTRNLKVDCGCFAFSDIYNKYEAWTTLLRDIALIGPILFVLIKGKNKYLWQH